MMKLNRILTVILVGALLCALGFLGYILITPKMSEEFTEFYILDRNGQTRYYPAEFITENNEVIQVRYSDNVAEDAAYAYVTVGIVNYENKLVKYTIRAQCDEETMSLYYEGRQVSSIGPITLAHGETWEHIIGFALLNTGDNQKVKFIQDKDGAQESDVLYLWVDVRKRD